MKRVTQSMGVVLEKEKHKCIENKGDLYMKVAPGQEYGNGTQEGS